MGQGRAARSAFFVFRMSKATIIDWKDHYMPCSAHKVGAFPDGKAPLLIILALHFNGAAPMVSVLIYSCCAF